MLGHLGTSREQLRASGKRLRVVLGESWRRRGGALGFLGNALRVLGGLLGRLGIVLEASWGLLEPSSRRLYRHHTILKLIILETIFQYVFG